MLGYKDSLVRILSLPLTFQSKGMHSPSQADDPPERIDHLSAVLGAAIALLTLVMPLYIIASYSSGSPTVNTTQNPRP